jgi:hypothetical protein
MVKNKWDEGLKALFKGNGTISLLKALPLEQKSEFATKIFSTEGITEGQRNLIETELVVKPYAGIFLLSMLPEFRKIQKYELFNKCQQNVDSFDITALSGHKKNEETLMQFMRGVRILDEKDDKRKEGEKLIQILLKHPIFTKFQNETMQVCDHHSEIEDEIHKPMTGAFIIREPSLKMYRKQILANRDLIIAVRTGNIEVLRGLFEKHDLRYISDIRGVDLSQVDDGEPDYGVTAESIMWNPVHHAIDC